jgi:hypothetical protein
MANEPTKSQPVIPDSILDLFRSALSLPDENLRKINDWAKSNSESLLGSEFEDTSVHENLGVPADKFYTAISAISGFLFAAEETPDYLEAYVEALNEKGLSNSAEKAKLLLAGIDADPSTREYARRKALALQSVVATLSSVDCVCDLRAVFRRLPSPGRSDRHLKEVKALLGFEPVALVGLTVNDASGEDEACVFQATERGLRNLIKTLEETVVQLQLIKESIPGSIKYPKSSPK